MGWLRRRRDGAGGAHGAGSGGAAGGSARGEAPTRPAAGEDDARNRETDRMLAYHAATRHSYASVHGGGWSLDWDNQPNPFRRYDGAPRTPLHAPGGAPGTAPARGTSAVLRSLGGADGAPWPEAGLPLLSGLLHHAMAVSAWKHVPGTEVRYSLRVNPSSGNLHPTETWLAVSGLSDLPDGLYHFDVRGHALERRRDGGALAALARTAGLPGGRGVLVALTTIFWREAWKYRDRAYRYCLHDAGHAAASIAAAARGLGLAAAVHGHFADREAAEVLALHGTDEQPLLLVDLRPTAASTGPSAPAERTTSSGVPLGPPLGEPNRLSEEVHVHPLIEGVHASTLVEGGACPQLAPAADPPPDERPAGPELALPPPDASAEPLASVVRRRRSAVDYLPEARMDAAAFSGLLHDALSLPRSDAAGTLAGGTPTRLVDLYAYVHRVDGVPPGCYRVRPGAEGPSLVPVRAGDVRGAAAGLSLGQELAGHAICAFSMIADLSRGGAAFGNRAYRHAHVEAGMLGQGLYLAATARGIDATGIGAFYDQDVQRWLGLVGPARQVIYHHSIGKAAPDPRLADADVPGEMRDGG